MKWFRAIVNLFRRSDVARLRGEIARLKAENRYLVERGNRYLLAIQDV